MIKRVEIIIYLNFRSDSKKYLQNIGLSVEYVNKKQGYAVTYADEKNLGRIINNLKKMRGFKRYDIQDTELVSFDINSHDEENDIQEEVTPLVEESNSTLEEEKSNQE